MRRLLFSNRVAHIDPGNNSVSLQHETNNALPGGPFVQSVSDRTNICPMFHLHQNHATDGRWSGTGL